jgi:hypothetical protein
MSIDGAGAYARRVDPDRDVPPARSRRGRPFLIAASLAPFIAALSFLWFGTTEGASASGEDAPTVARIVCRGGTTTIETPVVRAQADGVHLLVDADVQELKFSVDDDRGTRGWELTPDTTYPFATTEWIAPGRVRVQCGTSAGVTNGAAFEVIDPEGLWHDGRLACIESGDFDQRGSFPFYTDVNPLPEAIARAVPGVLATDAISYYGYPLPPQEQASESYRIVRDGQVVGSIEIASYDDRTFAYGVWSCDASRIGMPGEPTSGQLATPFELPGLPHCDPYASSCTTVYLTATRYAAIRGEDPDRYTLSELPWMACLETQPEGCPPDPDDVVLQILLAPPDAELFVSRQGCGSSETTACP